MSGKNNRRVYVRGAGDLATATIIRLHNAGYEVLASEVEKPTVIRQTVSFATAMYKGSICVEGVKGVAVCDLAKASEVLESGDVPIIVDPLGRLISAFDPFCVVDAIIAKRNLGTRLDMAPCTIALGPGFEAGKDALAVIETMRGHDLARIYYQGTAQKNTGIPGIIAGFGAERVVHAPQRGIFSSTLAIGDLVHKGDIIAHVGSEPVLATIDGMLRGLLESGLSVSEGFKIADIDPRGSKASYQSVSDKARAIAGSVLEVLDRAFYLDAKG